jgi:hypothetical protein
MKLQAFIISEELTTTTVGNLDPDSATSNKILKLQLKDRMIVKLVDYLKKRKNTKVTVKGDIATIDLPYNVPQELMKALSKYTLK